MRAVGYQRSLPATDPLALTDIEVSRPHCEAHDVLVRVEGIGLNPVDTKIRQRKAAEGNHYVILGWDAAGTVVECGEAVTDFSKGDAVWYAGAVDRDGCNAEFQVVDSRLISKRPLALSAADAAAMPLTFLTAWELLFERLQLPAEEPAVLLITGAAGGVGSALIQLAKALTSATVIATASRPETKQWVKQLGADVVINHHQPFAPQLCEHGIHDVTHVASLTHTDQHFTQLIELLAPHGHFALIDDPAQPIDILTMKQKSLSLHWEFMFTRSMFQTADMARQGEILSKVAELTDAGTITTTMTTNLGSINAANLRTAHSQLESHHTVGKIVLAGFDR